jgi:Cu-Zn family superoxide dismutase
MKVMKNASLRMSFIYTAAPAAALLALSQAPTAPADDGARLTAKAEFRNLEGEVVESALLTQTPQGVLIIADLYNLAPGTPGFHIHAVGPDGKGHVETLAASVTLGAGPNSLFDEDGSSLVIHAAPDDYATDSSGNSGDRVACAAVTRR